MTETREEAIGGLVERWKADNGIQNPKDVLLLASLNAEVRAINRQCQEERLRAGALSEEKLSVGGDDIHVHDRVLLTKRERKLGVENGFMGEVVSIDHEKAGLLVRLDQDGRPVSLRVEEYGAKNIRLGYASTVHKSQGRTVEHCHVLMGGHMTDLHLGYVQASRCSRIDPPVYRPVSCRAGPQRSHPSPLPRPLQGPRHAIFSTGASREPTSRSRP